MSAELPKPNSYGANTTFWRFSGVDIRRNPAILRIFINGYVSQEAYLAGAEPITVFDKTIYESDIPVDLNNLEPGTPAYQLFGMFYTIIMADDFFTGAIPV